MTVRLRFAGLLLVAGAAACTPKTDQAASGVGNATENAFDSLSNATANAVDAAGDALKATPTGRQFADKAAKSDAFEIAAAKLARTNADSADIKSFASKMIAAHTESTAKVKAAAAKARPEITPDATLTDSQQSKLADLGKLKGADFDKAYVDNQVDAHEDALSLMKAYAKDGDTPSLKAAAGEIAPIVQKHLGMARALRK